MKPSSVLPADYPAFLADLKARIQSARISAARAVNGDLILLYWDIGQAIMKKQQQRGWGDAVVETLSRDLGAEFPWVTGFSIQNLWRMRQFYLDHISPDFLSQVVRVFPPAGFAHKVVVFHSFVCNQPFCTKSLSLLLSVSLALHKKPLFARLFVQSQGRGGSRRALRHGGFTADGYPFNAGQLEYDSRYAKTPAVPVNEGPRL